MERLKFNYVLTYHSFYRYTDKMNASNNKHEEEDKDLAFLNCDLTIAKQLEEAFQKTYGRRKEKDLEESYELIKDTYDIHQYVKPILASQHFVYSYTYTLLINNQKFKINTTTSTLSDLLIALESLDLKAIVVTKEKETL